MKSVGNKISWVFLVLGILFCAHISVEAQGLYGVTRRTVMLPAPGVDFQLGLGGPTATVTKPVPTPLRLQASSKAASRRASLEAKKLAYQIKRAKAGSSSAQYDLAMRYIKGDGLPKDSAKALHWLNLASGKGHSKAVRQLATLRGNASPGVGKELASK